MNSSERTIDGKLMICGGVFFAIGAAIHAYRFVIEWRFLGRALHARILTSSSFALLELFFIVVFVACLVGLLIRRLPGRFLSILGLVGVLAGYAYWYSYSTRALRALEDDVYLKHHPDLMPRHFMGLVGAGWWDIAILLAVVVVLALQVKFLISTFRHRDRSN